MDDIYRSKSAASRPVLFGRLWQQLRRTAKIGFFGFLLLHFYHIVLIGLGPAVFNRLSLDYGQPLPRLVHLVLFGCVLFYAIDSLRLLILDLQPHLWRYQRQSVFTAAVIFALFFIPSALLLLLDTLLPY